MDQVLVNKAREPITDEDFNEWRTSDTTKKIIARMDMTVEHLKQQWYEGKYKDGISEDGASTKDEEAYWRGFANGVHEFLRIGTAEEAPELKGLK